MRSTLATYCLRSDRSTVAHIADPLTGRTWCGFPYDRAVMLGNWDLCPRCDAAAPLSEPAADHPLRRVWGLCRELDRRANIGTTGRPNPIPDPQPAEVRA